jgi:hypothetical protein
MLRKVFAVSIELVTGCDFVEGVYYCWIGKKTVKYL